MKLSEKIKTKLEEFFLSKKWGVIGITISVTWILASDGEIPIYDAWIASCALVGIGVHAQGNTDSVREATKIAYDRKEVSAPPKTIKEQGDQMSVEVDES